MTFKFMVVPKRNEKATPFEITVSGPHETVEEAKAHVEKYSTNLIIKSVVVDAEAAPTPAPAKAPTPPAQAQLPAAGK